MSEFFVGRQPIVNAREKTVAYELLFRTDPAFLTEPVDGDVATARVIAGIYGSSGLESLAGGKRLFINATRQTLTSGLFRMLPPSSIIVEVLEDVVVDEELVREVTALKREGYRIALDDWTEDSRQRALLPLADIIKVEIGAFTQTRLEASARALRARGLLLLAEKVETREQHEYCRRVGFQLFQGHLYAKARTIRAPQLGASMGTVLRLLRELSRPEANLARVTDFISQDPGFTLRVLRLCNSTPISGGRHFADIPSAVRFLGIRRLQQLATLVALSERGRSGEGGQTVDDGLRVALTRARACELLAPEYEADVAAAFLVGLLSCAEDLLGMQPGALLEELPLEAGSRRVLRGQDQDSPLGRCLAAAQAFEAPEETAEGIPVTTRRFSLVYLSAIKWANAVIAESLAGRGDKGAPH